MKFSSRLSFSDVKEYIITESPQSVLLVYHFLVAAFALLIYGNASKHMIIIGVTGTKGKTSTAILIHNVLTACGFKVGLLSTVENRIGEKVLPNEAHMTMRGRGFVHRMLRDMRREGCHVVIIETSSEGIRQFRNLGIQYDSVIFTNLAPEHLVTHKTYDAYRATKARLFKHHAKGSIKYINGQPVKRFVLLNADDNEAPFFSEQSTSDMSEKIFFGFDSKANHRAELVKTADGDNSFKFLGDTYTVSLPGAFPVLNALPAIFFASRYCSVPPQVINNALQQLLPGRLELLNEGQDFLTFCDYAHEPLSLTSVSTAVRDLLSGDGRLIMVAGAVGGGRWRYNAKQIGEAVAALSDIVVVTDINTYHDDPQEIMDAVLAGIHKHAQCEYYAELDRRKAINKALSIAKKGDIVLITGKGAEIVMIVKGKHLPWNERLIIREELKKILKD